VTALDNGRGACGHRRRAALLSTLHTLKALMASSRSRSVGEASERSAFEISENVLKGIAAVVVAAQLLVQPFHMLSSPLRLLTLV
jgi:hypothetical protein